MWMPTKYRQTLVSQRRLHTGNETLSESYPQNNPKMQFPCGIRNQQQTPPQTIPRPYKTQKVCQLNHQGFHQPRTLYKVRVLF